MVQIRKQTVFNTLVFFTGLLINSSFLFGANYYCDPSSGSNSNSGTEDLPWKTLEEVFTSGKVFEAGDTIFLLEGYHGSVVITGDNSENVVIQAKSDDSPTLKRLVFNNASHWLVSGITVSPELVDEYPIFGSSEGIVQINSNSDNITVQESLVYAAEDIDGWSASEILSRFRTGIYCNGPDCKILNNEVRNTRFSIVVFHNATSTIVRNNLIEGISEDGIRCLANYNIIEYNTLRNWYGLDNAHDDGFQCWTGGHDGIAVGDETKYGGVIRGNIVIASLPGNPHPPTYGTQGIGWFDGMFEDYVVENNVISTNMWHGISFYGAKNCKIINNTVVRNPHQTLPGIPWIKITAHKDGTLSTGNIVRNNLTASMSNDDNIGTVDNNFIIIEEEDYADHFVDYNGLDFHLKPGSNAIDNGSSLDAPSTDLDGVQRPFGAAYDIGAYEYPTEITDVNGINLSEDSITLDVGQLIELTASVTPPEATDKSILWASSDDEVVHINNSGKVVGLKGGAVSIFATTNDGGFTDTCIVMVNTPEGDYNVALFKPVTVSDEDLPATPGLNLVDGDTSEVERWSANGRPQYAIIDLGANYNISRFELYTFQKRAYQYTIDAKVENGDYVTVVDRSSNTDDSQPIADTATVMAQYIRINVTGLVNNSSSWVSLTELKVFGLLADPVSGTHIKEGEVAPVIIYPNPNSGSFTIHLNGFNSNLVSEIQIFSLTGEMVYSDSFYSNDKEILAINLNDKTLIEGVYIIKITNGSNTHTVKMVSH